MAGTPTPIYQWPIPALTDPPDGPAQIGALGNAIDATVQAIDAKVRGALVNFTGTLGGLNLGNAPTPVYWYIRLGNCVLMNISITAAAASATTAFTSGNVTLTLPVKCNGSNSIGQAYWNAAGTIKLGICTIGWDQTTLTMTAIRQTDLAAVAPATVWGTAAWPTNSTFTAYILFPVA